MQKALIIHDFMLKDKNLKGARLLIYALVYSFCSIDNSSNFFMRFDKIAEFLNIALSSVYDNMSWLIDNKYICIKDDKYSLLDTNCTPLLSVNEDTIKIARYKWVNR